MSRLKRLTIVGIVTMLLTGLSLPCSAADDAFKNIFENAAYGGLVGTLVGGALLAFTHTPSDHADYIYYGAATGILAGAAYGIVKSSRSLVTVENGKVKLAMPTIIPELHDANGKGSVAIALKAELLKGTF